MTKQEIHSAFIAKISAKLDAVTQAAKQTFATATDEAHHAEGKYDTFSLESSYLARGQAKRVQELSESRDRLEQMQLNSFGKNDTILLSALIKLESDDGSDKRTLFFAPCAGGETIEIDGSEIMIITSAAPLGKAIFGKKAGDAFEIKLGPIPKTFKIISVE
jgi:transcription elongation GreA/GreB family factor